MVVEPSIALCIVLAAGLIGLALAATAGSTLFAAPATWTLLVAMALPVVPLRLVWQGADDLLG